MKRAFIDVRVTTSYGILSELWPWYIRTSYLCARTQGLHPFVVRLCLHREQPIEFVGSPWTRPIWGRRIVTDASKYLWLKPCPTADAATTFDALMDWFAAFGVCHWVSDQGTHFKNNVISELQHALGAHHHFTTPRCPWANGTVEVVMREALRCFRALLSEWRLQPQEWPRATKVVQLALNNAASPALGGTTPLTAMTGQQAMSPLDTIVVPGELKTATLEEIYNNRQANIARLQAALDEMHKKCADANRAKRDRSRHAHKQSPSVKMAQFAIGDFVLSADVWAHTRNKLSVRWCGPAEVTATTSNWIFEVRNLITGATREVHASRLKFYADSSLQVTEELLLHIVHNSEGHVVQELRDCRYNSAKKEYEVLVRWRGLQEIEDSWEPAQTLKEDVTTTLKNYVKDNQQSRIVRKMAEALDIPIPPQVEQDGQQ